MATPRNYLAEVLALALNVGFGSKHLRAMAKVFINRHLPVLIEGIIPFLT